MKTVIIGADKIRSARETMTKGLCVSVLGMLVMACSGCGGGGGGSQQSVQAAQSKPVLIEEYGDSTTYGTQLINGVVSQTANSDPAVMQRLLQAQFGPTVTVSNQGVNSMETSNLLNGTDGVHLPWAQQMAQSKAQVVTLNFALNDAYRILVLDSRYPPETTADYAANLTQLVQIAQAAGKKVVLFEPNPTCNPLNPNVTPYVQALDGVAAQLNVPIVSEYQTMLALSNWQGMLTDCTHPTDAGYQWKAQQEFPVIAPIVAALR